MELDVDSLDTELKQFVTQNLYKDAEDYLNRIEEILYNENIKNADIKFIASNIFNNKYNFFTFIDQIKNNKKWDKVTSAALKFVATLYQKIPNHLTEHYNLTINECANIATSNISAYDKEKSIYIICSILKCQKDIVPRDTIEKIYLKFLKLLTCSMKQSNTVKRSFFIILGVIAKYYPDVVTNEEKFVIYSIQPLKNPKLEVSGAATLYSGIFDGLSDFFENFNHVFKDEDLKTIYNCALILADPKWINEKHRNDDNRCAINFLTKHSFIWEKCLKVNECISWHNKLKGWYASENTDNRKAGFNGIYIFYEELSKILKARNGDEYKHIFKTFFDEFQTKLKNNQIDSETRLVLHGISTFSKAYKKYQPNDYDKIFGKIIAILNENYLSNEEINKDKLEYFPDYIKCCSVLMENIETTDELINLLQKVSVLMVRSYPKITSIYHNLIIESLILCFVSVFKCDEQSFDIFVQRFVCEGIIWSCDGDPIAITEETDQISYKKFIPLWKNLIDVSNGVYKKHQIAPDLRKSITSKIFDELIIRLMVSTTKLNLKLKNNKNDPEEDSKPEKPNDYIVFINMVDLYIAILETCHFDLFKKWIQRFSRHFVQRSLDNPMVSGFYKLLAQALKISDCLNYFDDMKVKEDKKMVFDLVKHFLEGVISKVQQYKEDLQIACLNLVFVAPTAFIEMLLPTLIPVFEVSLTVGLSYLKIADLAIDTLDRWHQSFEPSLIKPLLASVLPYFDPYLRNKVYTGDPNLKTKYIKPKKYRRGANNQTLQNYGIESELLQIQKKIIVFISQLEPDTMLCILKGGNSCEKLPWNGKPELRFEIPFVDMKGSIYLDRIVPRIVELALYSGDRKTRSSACEVLHGVMTYLIGTIRSMSNSTSERNFKKLFRVIIWPIIQLGCDSDELIRQIFNEFNFQLIHWFTSEEKLTSFESKILIETLMSLISHPTNTTLRDYSGKCINEYVTWSIRQYHVQEVEKIYQNIKIIIDQICSFCIHPDPNKRFGAALAFNNLYITLREEESMVINFWIPLFYYLIKNLNFETDEVNKERNDLEVSIALDHIERVIKEKKALFNTLNNSCKIIAEIEGPLLENVLTWLLKQTGTNNAICRSKSIQIFLNLVPYVESCKNPTDFIVKSFPDKSNSWFLDIYENNGISNIALTDFKSILKFLRDLLRCLDGYTWVLKYTTFDYNHLSQNSQLEVAINYFTKNIATKSLATFSTTELDFYNDLRSETVKKIFNLLIVLVKRNPIELKFVNDDLWSILTLWIFDPKAIGFNIVADECRIETEKMENDKKIILNTLTSCLPKNCEGLLKMLSDYFDRNFVDIEENLREENVPFTQRQLLKGLFVIQGTNLKNKVVHMPKLFLKAPELIFNSLVENGATVYLRTSFLTYTELLLKLSLEFKETVPILYGLVNNKTEVSHHERFTSICHGKHFLNTYNKIIMDHFSQNVSELMSHCFKTPIMPSVANAGDILLEVLKYICENRKIFRVDYTVLVQDIMKNCQNYFVFNETMDLSERKYQINFLLYISRLLVKPFTYFSNLTFLINWFLLTLLYESNTLSTRNMLEFKVKLLKLLPSFTDVDNTQNIPLESTLNTYILKIDDLISNSQLGDDKVNLDAYNFIFDEWLKVLYISKSPLVLSCAGKVFMKVANKSDVLYLESRFLRFFYGLGVEQQYNSLKIVYDMCFDETFDSSNRYKLASVFFTAMVKTCSYDGFEDFFSKHVVIIFENLRQTVCNENIFAKTVYFILLELLFSRIDIKKVKEGNCRVSREIIATSGLLKVSFVLLKSVRKEMFVPNDKELYRLYNCNAFNAFLTYMSNTKRDAKDLVLFTYLFTEDPSKNEVVWTRIINCEEKLTFNLDFQTLPKKKKLIANIRNELKREIEPEYVLTQNIFDSSLSEDLCQYDFTKTSLRSSTDFLEKNESFYQISTESIDLNNHECMGTICGLIEHIVTNQISPSPTDQVTELPGWLSQIREVMLRDSTEQNIKIFFGRVIHNNNNIFEKYSQFFYGPIINLICTFDNLNYFVADMLDMILRWPHNSISTESNYIMKLVTFLIDKIHNDRKDILKFNLELLKNVFEIWKEFVVVPCEMICNKLASESNLSSTIQILGIFLANRIVPFSEMTIKKFFDGLCRILLNFSFVQNPTAEVVGMMLENIMEKIEWQQYFQDFEKKLSRLLDQMYGLDFNKFIQILEHVQIHFPSITKNYFNKIYNKLTSSQKNVTISKICLKNILRSTEFVNNVKLFSLRDLLCLFEKSDEDVQLLTLQLVEKIINTSQLKDLNYIVNVMLKFKTNLNPNIREAMYNVFIEIYKKCGDLEAKKISRTILLDGLLDTDSDLQEKLQNFWCSQGTGNLCSNFLNILNDLYSTETESNYLGYSTYFLLESCKNASDYNKPLFEHQLSECKFTKQDINPSLCTQNVFATPMHSDIFKRKIRSTQTPKFTPTQSMTVGNSLSSVSSFLFNTESTITTRLFTSNDIEMHKKSTLNKTYVRYAQRFLKSKTDVKKYFAKKETGKKVKRDEFRRNRVKQRHANVQLYRNYHLGDFPIIVIPVSSIIQPLQVLAKRDNTIARNIFVMLFCNLVENLPKDQSAEFLQQIFQLITKIFEETTSYVPDVIATLFDILLQQYQNTKMDPDLLYSLSKNSGLLSTGALLLENQEKIYENTFDPKRGSGSLNEFDVYWVKLAEIYKELKLWDGVSGIFTDKMEFNNELVMAIKNESDGLWRNAIENYNKIRNDNSYVCKNFYCDSILKCYANLCEWKKISEHIEEKVGLDRIWDEGYCQENLLPWFFIAGMHETLQTTTTTMTTKQTRTNTMLLSKLDIWKNNKSNWKFIKDKFSEELSILRITANDFTRSKYYLENCFSNFLEDYSNISPLLSEVRITKLFNLQKTVEIHKYLSAISDTNESNLKNNIDTLFAFWKKQLNFRTNSFLTSESKFVYRKFLIEKTKEKLSSLDEEDRPEYLNKLDRISSEIDYNFISFALDSKNYHAAKKIIEENQSRKKDIKLILAASSCNFLKLEQELFDLSACQTEITKLTKILEENEKRLNSNLLIKYTNLIFKFYNKIYENVDLISQKLDPENLKENCVNFLKKGIEFGERDQNVTTQNLIENYSTLVLFLKKINNSGAYNEEIIKYVFRSMKSGCKQASQLFSYSLRLLEKSSSYSNLFIEESETVPCWMFIQWIPQLLANLDTDCSKSVSGILKKIAQNYPQAVMYPYRLRKEKLKIDESNEEIVRELDSLLLNTKVELFIQAISCVQVPQKNLRDQICYLLRDTKDENTLRKSIDNFKNSFCKIVNNCSKNIDSISGPVFQRFKNYCRQILDVVEHESGDVEKIKMELMKIRSNVLESNMKFPNVIDFYSPWLANFQTNSEGFSFEVPGQYKGDRKPLPQYHTIISGFKNEIHVYSSLQKPIKITMLGNDAKEYEFLIKLGDDLRQDERIQQICALANDILQNDKQCVQRHLSIQTYNVTPLTGKVGLIQFVKDTRVLKNLICYEGRKDEDEMEKIKQECIVWIQRAQKYKINVNPDYYYLYNACLAYNRDEVCPKYKEFASKLPFDKLSKGFWSISLDVESFTSLRSQFITSYSTMCIIHWLLGIGDRHLNNTLVCEKTGHAIGIDFGLAFDTGIRNCPYPELVPFRLTPQILNLIEPFREQGFVKLTMIQALKAFRKEKEILLSAMDIFINEPTLSWLESAQNKEENELISTDFIPREKLANAESKFNGCNPIKITLSELEKRNHDKQIFDVLSDITRGHQQFNIRNTLPSDGLTEENQVLCLLDQATDTNILGRCYFGYEPWV